MKKPNEINPILNTIQLIWTAMNCDRSYSSKTKFKSFGRTQEKLFRMSRMNENLIALNRDFGLTPRPN